MSKLGRFIKKVAYSEAIPDLLFEWYFHLKNKRAKDRLLNGIAEKGDVINLLNKKTQAHWMPRIENVMQSKDNESIPRHLRAGEIVDGDLIMHNGLRIEPLSYYSYGMLKMLKDNRGVHEPQEEKIFQEVLKHLPKTKSLTMLELGAYWSFYSMWFLQQFPEGECTMVEPDRMNLYYGKANFKQNNLKGKFIQAGIGKADNNSTNVLTVDTICKKQKIEFLDILHSDIQGFEVEMLEGSKKMLSEKRVGYAFISTHSNELHEQCYDILKKEYGFELVASANLKESYSWDGILVMKLPAYPGLNKVSISKK
ncbi:MAG: FkbM family methyltransferase [Saprospiraceae bacterium]